jgi:hypothetical protein
VRVSGRGPDREREVGDYNGGGHFYQSGRLFSGTVNFGRETARTLVKRDRTPDSPIRRLICGVYVEMLQRLDDLECASRAKRALASERAMEKAAQRPQMMKFNGAMEPAPPAVCSGGAAGLARLVGQGRRKRAAKKEAGGSDGVMLDGKGVISDLNIPIVSGIARIFGLGKESEMASDSESDKEMHGGAREQGKRLADHLSKLHGPEYAKEFHSGMGYGEAKEMHGGFWGALASLAAPLIGKLFGQGKMTKEAHDELMGMFEAQKGKPKLGRTRKMDGGSYKIGHAMMSPAEAGQPGGGPGGQNVPPGGLAPKTYGNPPQAPASFKRNTVGMGRAGAGKLEITHHGGAGRAGAGAAGAGKRAARGAKISALMREHGMTLGQASKYLKEHPEA